MRVFSQTASRKLDGQVFLCRSECKDVRLVMVIGLFAIDIVFVVRLIVWLQAPLRPVMLLRKLQKCSVLPPRLVVAKPHRVGELLSAVPRRIARALIRTNSRYGVWHKDVRGLLLGLNASVFANRFPRA